MKRPVKNDLSTELSNEITSLKLLPLFIRGKLATSKIGRGDKI